MRTKRRTKKYRGGDNSSDSNISSEERFREVLDKKKEFDNMPTTTTLGLGIITVVGIVVAGIFLKKKL